MQLFIHRLISLFYTSVVDLYTFLVLIPSVWFQCAFVCLGPYCRMLFCLGIRKSPSFYNCGALLLSAFSHFIELLKQLSKQRSALRYFASRETGRVCWTNDYFKALRVSSVGHTVIFVRILLCYLALAKLVQAEVIHWGRFVSFVQFHFAQWQVLHLYKRNQSLQRQKS